MSRRNIAIPIEVLGTRRFVAGLEVGCSIGELTRKLAPKCDTLLAIDIVDPPLQARCKALCRPAVGEVSTHAGARRVARAVL